MSLTESFIYEENHVMTYTYSYLHRYRFGRLAHNLFVTFAGFAIILLKKLFNAAHKLHLVAAYIFRNRSKFKSQLRCEPAITAFFKQEYKEANFQKLSSPLGTVMIFSFSFIFSNIFYAPKNVHISL